MTFYTKTLPGPETLTPNSSLADFKAFFEGIPDEKFAIGVWVEMGADDDGALKYDTSCRCAGGWLASILVNDREDSIFVDNTNNQARLERLLSKWLPDDVASHVPSINDNRNDKKVLPGNGPKERILAHIELAMMRQAEVEG